MNQNDFSFAASAHSSSLMSHALKFTNNEDDAKDLVQETLIKGIRFCHKFDEHTNIKGWLYVIMRNTFINFYRKEKRISGTIGTEEEISSAHLMSSATRNGSIGEFIKADIQKALQSIKKEYSYPFIRYFEGYRYEEIATELKLPLGTVKTHIHQARLLLKKYLKKYQEGGQQHRYN